MTRPLTSLIVFAVFTTLLFTKCGKYEEGPGFSLASKKSRVANQWQLEEYTYEGEKEELSEEQKETIFQLSHKGKVSAISKKDTLPLGTWKFVNNKEEIEFTDAYFSLKKTSRILRLTKKEMWLEENNSGRKALKKYRTAK